MAAFAGDLLPAANLLHVEFRIARNIRVDVFAVGDLDAARIFEERIGAKESFRLDILEALDRRLFAPVEGEERGSVRYRIGFMEADRSNVFDLPDGCMRFDVEDVTRAALDPSDFRPRLQGIRPVAEVHSVIGDAAAERKAGLEDSYRAAPFIGKRLINLPHRAIYRRGRRWIEWLR